MILCDIGNSYYHFLINNHIVHRRIDEPLTPFEGEIYYITVNRSAEEKLLLSSKCVNIASFASLSGAYEGMGIDRIVACIGVHDGIVVDAGSAITIDVMDQGVFKGGYILSGFGALHQTMREISPALDKAPIFTSESFHPKQTALSIGQGYKKAVTAMIQQLASEENKSIYLTGGDAKLLCDGLKNCTLDEKIVFRGMKEILATKGIIC